MPKDGSNSGGTVSTSTVGMWDDSKEIQDLRDGEGGS
jgi:hypothetical protein